MAKKKKPLPIGKGPGIEVFWGLPKVSLPPGVGVPVFPFPAKGARLHLADGTVISFMEGFQLPEQEGVVMITGVTFILYRKVQDG